MSDGVSSGESAEAKAAQHTLGKASYPPCRNAMECFFIL